jgi:hypothetical protein
MKQKPRTLEEAFERMAAAFPLAKGSLALVRRPCIRRRCRACQSGQKHAAWIFSLRQGGRQRCRYVPKDLVVRLREAIAHGRRVEALLTQAGVALIEHYRRERPGRTGRP